jgi:hypothetical protein
MCSAEFGSVAKVPSPPSAHTAVSPRPRNPSFASVARTPRCTYASCKAHRLSPLVTRGAPERTRRALPSAPPAGGTQWVVARRPPWPPSSPPSTPLAAAPHAPRGACPPAPAPGGSRTTAAQRRNPVMGCLRGNRTRMTLERGTTPTLSRVMCVALGPGYSRIMAVGRAWRKRRREPHHPNHIETNQSQVARTSKSTWSCSSYAPSPKVLYIASLEHASGGLSSSCEPTLGGWARNELSQCSMCGASRARCDCMDTSSSVSAHGLKSAIILENQIESVREEAYALHGSPLACQFTTRGHTGCVRRQEHEFSFKQQEMAVPQ